MRQEGQPSVQEILRSIRSVMARDNREIVREAHREDEEGSAQQPPEPADEEEAGDVLGLSEIDAGIAMGAESHSPEIDAAREQDADEAAGIALSNDEAAPAEAEGSDQPAGDDLPGHNLPGEGLSDEDAADAEPLTNNTTATAMRESLAALALLAEPGKAGENSVESMVRQMLRPMLSQWLDANLPQIVEREVKAEISRIVGAKS